MAEILFLLLAVCLDSFTACAGFGAERIKIPISSALIISGTGAVFLFLSLGLGGVLSEFLPPAFCRGLSFGILAMMGILNLLEQSLKHFLRKRQGEKSLLFSISGIEFALRLYLDETVADQDNSKTLSPKESAALAGALSLDSLVTGFGMGLGSVSPLLAAAAVFLAGVGAVLGGCALGKRLGGKEKPRFSFAGGIILLLLAFGKLFSLGQK